MGEWNNYLKKLAGDMPPFLEQDRPAKVKEIYSALKRDHPDMPAEMKARIAARQGKPGKQHQGPPYKGPLTKGASLEGIIEAAPRYAHLADDVAILGARVAGMEPQKKPALKPKPLAKQASLDQALGCLYQEYGPALQKHAAADFYANLDKDRLTLEALGTPFCKLAAVSQLDPWVMAARVVRSYDNLVKAASGQPSQAQELASFYLAWGDEMEKKAGLIGNTLSRAKAVGSALFGQKGALRSARHLAGQGVVKSEMPGALEQVGQTLKKQDALQRMGGGDIARGQQLHTENVAARQARTSQAASNAPGTVAAEQKFFGQALPTGNPAAAQPSPMGDYLLGAATVGGLGGLGGLGYLTSGDDSQPQPQYGEAYA
jgi:hypothetical protein